MVALKAWSDVARAMPISSRFSGAGISPSVPHQHTILSYSLSQL
jgi:hypothetical protein